MKKYKNSAGSSILMTYSVMIISFLLPACKKFVVADPPVTQASAATVYGNNSSAAAVLTGIYTRMIIDNSFSSGTFSVGFLTGLSGDELVDYLGYPSYAQYYTNSMTSESLSFWQEIYQQLHVVNAALEGLNNSSTLTPTVKEQLIGEAKFLRAFFHFYAVNLYGAVPLVLSSDYRINQTLGRTSTDSVYTQIVQDLKEAQSSLPETYNNGTGNPVTERVRPNKAAATLLLARVFLYKKEYANAITEADKLINDGNYQLEEDLNNVFSTSSKEAIWQLQSVRQGYNTFDGYGYILNSLPGNDKTPAALNTQLVNAFTEGDNRFVNWIGSYTEDNSTYYYYPYKYKVGEYNVDLPVSEYTTVLRLGELYLIRAEAKIQTGQIADGIADVNKLRKRSRMMATVTMPDPLPDLSESLLLDDAMKAVLHERQVELFTEWGHRWFDLKRTDSVNNVMNIVAPLKGPDITWEPYKALFPIPKYELETDFNLKQNPGYQ
jgi:starch-binding outer membrane protein, SusD/RagB family